MTSPAREKLDFFDTEEKNDGVADIPVGDLLALTTPAGVERNERAEAPLHEPESLDGAFAETEIPERQIDEGANTTPVRKDRTMLMVAGVAVVILSVLGGLVYMAFGILGGPKTPAADRTLSAFDQPMAGPAAAAKSSDSLIADGDDLAAALAAPTASPSVTEQGAPIAEPETPAVALNAQPDGIAMQEISKPEPSSQPPQPTEEEQLYDKALSSAQSLDLPPGAIKIDDKVIAQSAQTARVEAFASALKETQHEVTVLKQGVGDLQGAVARLAQIVEGSQSAQIEQRKQLDNLAKRVDGAEKQAAGFPALEKRIDAALQRAQPSGNTASSSPKGSDPKQVQTKPAIKPPTTNEEVAKARPVVLPPPTKVAVVTAPTAAASETAKAHQNPKCDGRTVSNNWRVKGINAKAAYIVRVQDNESLFVSEGSVVEGFGVVQSFDRFNRTVCTSEGLVRR